MYMGSLSEDDILKKASGNPASGGADSGLISPYDLNLSGCLNCFADEKTVGKKKNGSTALFNC
jgi:hypothetical protein